MLSRINFSRSAAVMVMCLSVFLASQGWGQDTSGSGGGSGTPYARTNLLRATNQADLLNRIGIGLTNQAVDANTFAVPGNVLYLKPGAPLTNLNLYGNTTNKGAYYGSGLGLTNIGLSRVLYVDPTNGNDSVGKPYKTFLAAHTNAVDGDTIMLAAGWYTNDMPGALSLKSVTVRGAGQDITYMTGPTNQMLYLSKPCMLSDFTCWNTNIGAALADGNGIVYLDSTNIVLQNFSIISSKRCLLDSDTNTVSLYARNCAFYGGNRVLHMAQTNRLSRYRFENCKLITDASLQKDGQDDESITIVNGKQAECYFKGCDLGSTNGNVAVNATTCATLEVDDSSNDGVVVFDNCGLWYSSLYADFAGTVLNTNMFAETAGVAADKLKFYGKYDVSKMRGYLTMNGHKMYATGKAPVIEHALLPQNTVLIVTGDSWTSGTVVNEMTNSWLHWFTNYWCNDFVFMTNQSGTANITVSNVVDGYATNIAPYITSVPGDAPPTNYAVICTVGANNCVLSITNYWETFIAFSNMVRAITVTNNTDFIAVNLPAFPMISTPNAAGYFRTNWNNTLWRLCTISPRFKIYDFARDVNPENTVIDNEFWEHEGLHPDAYASRKLAEGIARCLKADYER